MGYSRSVSYSVSLSILPTLHSVAYKERKGGGGGGGGGYATVSRAEVAQSVLTTRLRAGRLKNPS
jgi:hypothetical protein